MNNKLQIMCIDSSGQSKILTLSANILKNQVNGKNEVVRLATSVHGTIWSKQLKTFKDCVHLSLEKSAASFKRDHHYLPTVPNAEEM